MNGKIRVFCVDDHPLMREGTAAVVNSQCDMLQVAEACNGREAIEYFGREKPDVTLMDLRLPDMSGIDAMSTILKKFPEARIIILTTFEYDTEIQQALAAGARAYVVKTMPPRELVDTIRQVHAGKKRISPEVAARLVEHLSEEPLTERELQVLQLAMEGNGNRDIGHHLFIAEETVKAHMKHTFEKLGAIDRTQAVTIALRRGLLHV